ncbi:MAG TPA: GW dipeptide domain-containing protein [Bacteroidales bacterium]
MKLLYLFISLAILSVSCESNSSAKKNTLKNPNQHEVVVKEVVQTSSYTYLLLQEEDAQYWAAVSRAEIEEGKTYYYDSFMEMKDFPSKELNKTFESIYFLSDLSDQPIPTAEEMAEQQHTGKVVTGVNETISVTPVEGGITIEELYKNRNDYAEQVVTVTGQVTKVNTGIMGKNWLHIQDGTIDGENYDLTITTDDIASIGDVVIFQGKISLNKDFGYGYAYDVLMEDAKKQNLPVQ